MMLLQRHIHPNLDDDRSERKVVRRDSHRSYSWPDRANIDATQLPPVMLVPVTTTNITTVSSIITACQVDYSLYKPWILVLIIRNLVASCLAIQPVHVS